MRVAPRRDLGDDAGIPRATRRRDRAGDVIGKYGRQRYLAPPEPSLPLQIRADVAQLGWDRGGARHDVEQDVPLRAEDHQRAEPDIRIEVQGDDGRHRDRKEHVRREGGEELRDRLNELRETWP